MAHSDQIASRTPASKPHADRTPEEHREAIEHFFASVDALPNDEYVANFLTEPAMNIKLISHLHGIEDDEVHAA